LAAGRLEHRVPEPAQDVRGQAAHGDFILDVEHRLVAAWELPHLLARAGFLTHFVHARHINREGRAHPNLAVHGDIAPALLHDSVAGRQTQARPLPFSLVVKNGSKICFFTSGVIPCRYRRW